MAGVIGLHARSLVMVSTLGERWRDAAVYRIS